MTKQVINVGTTANDNTGDPLRDAFVKCKSNFDELYNGIMPNGTPASSSATGVAGTIVWDSNYIYVCVAANTWKRAAIASW